uniref:Transmembrane protein 199 n=1 Tax=Hydatigena taeniaeformis TaxID=6205 RepID=A0A0R3X3E3_HYDTA
LVAGESLNPLQRKDLDVFYRQEIHANMKALGVMNLPPLWKVVRSSGIVLPEPCVPPRDIIVQQRVESLTRKFANMDYGRMTKHLPQLGSTARYKSVMMIINFVLVVIGSFIFGYFSYATPVQRIACGFTFALFVFFADLYFLLKNMEACELKAFPPSSNHTLSQSNVILF